MTSECSWQRCCHRLQSVCNYVINHGALSGGAASAGSPGTTSLMDFDPISWLKTGPRHPKTLQLSFLLMSCCRRYPPWGQPEKVSLFVMPLDCLLVSKTKIICSEGNKIRPIWHISLASGEESWELTCKTKWSTLECQVNVQAYASETVLLQAIRAKVSPLLGPNGKYPGEAGRDEKAREWNILRERAINK